ncbi:MAG: hypothetical protein H0W44_10730 [Gammaproteobacteria bacterium]|nr:hypothetical protein [Gammaproteobacteria bacterium]
MNNMRNKRVASPYFPNRTLDGHNYHPGDVTHRVYFGGGILYYDVIGTGTGSNPGFNNWLGIDLFLPNVQNVVTQFGVSN